MNAKYHRLALIKQLITSSKTSSQEDLAALLAEKGFPITQATLSRDLKEIKAAKVPDGMGGYHYRVADSTQVLPRDAVRTHIADDIRTIEFSGQMCVIHTLPGYANMVAAILDNGMVAGIMGTIAGDDTVLVIMRENTKHEKVLALMQKLIPGITTKLSGALR